MGRYAIQFTPNFIKKYNKIQKYDSKLYKRIENVLVILSDNPQHNSLRSHKVTLSDGREVFSSKITGDIRIIWNYSNITPVIIMYTIGGHSGKNKVYR